MRKNIFSKALFEFLASLTAEQRAAFYRLVEREIAESPSALPQDHKVFYINHILIRFANER